jgi:hypothetical protein
VAIYERVGGVFYTPELLAAETEELHAGRDYDSLTADEKFKVRAVVKEKFCACLLSTAEGQCQERVCERRSEGISCDGHSSEAVDE